MTPTTLRTAILFAALFALGGCWSEQRGVRGLATIRAEACHGDSVPSGSAAQQVSVELRCPGDDAPRASTVSDVGGRFFIDLEDDALAPACELTLRKDGYVGRRFTLEELCVHALNDGAYCDAASVVAELPPVPKSKPAAATEASEGSK